MKTTMKKIDEVFASERNTRKHPQKQIDEMCRSLKKFGQYRPLVVASNGEILVGNGLWQAMKASGKFKEVECIVLPANFKDADKKRLMLSDNKIFSLGTDDLVQIDKLLAELEKDNFDIAGFDDEILREMYAEVEEDIKSVGDMGKLNPEEKEKIKAIEAKREADPESTKAKGKRSSGYEAEPEEEAGSYINCPHCGMKIYL